MLVSLETETRIPESYQSLDDVPPDVAKHTANVAAVLKPWATALVADARRWRKEAEGVADGTHATFAIPVPSTRMRDLLCLAVETEDILVRILDIMRD